MITRSPPTDRGCLARGGGHVVTIARLLTCPASPLPSLVTLTSAIGGAGPLPPVTRASLASSIRGADITLPPAIVGSPSSPSSPSAQVGGVAPLLLLPGLLSCACSVLVVVWILAIVVIVVLIFPRHPLRYH